MRDVFRTGLMAILLLVPVIAYGDTEAGPISYATASSNGKYLFVMLAPGEAQVGGLPLVDSDRRISKHLAAKYPVSGLYLNDGSTSPLWTVDWYAISVIVPPDGVHLIRRGPWAKRLSDEALTFLAGGRVLRSYRISDLVDTAAALPHSSSHFKWEESAKLVDERHTLELTTFSKERYTFDYTTGEVASSRRPLRALIVIVAAVAFFIVVLLIKRRKVVAKAPV